MPIYEYKCLECQDQIEVRQRISDEPLKVCEKCGGKLEKQVSLSGFQFKGEGWYVTDYGKGGKVPAKPETANAPTTEKSSPTESTKTSEPASKPVTTSTKSD